MNLELSLVQKHHLSQQMRQSVHILQMNTQELTQYIKNIALENPVIEIDSIDKLIENEKSLHLKKLEWLEAMDDDRHVRYNSTVKTGEREEFLAKEEEQQDLDEYLNSQLLGMPLTEKELKLLRWLIANLDDDGYLSLSLQEIEQSFICTKEEAQNGIHLLQQLQPAGVGARNLQECLQLQLEKMSTIPDLVEDMIKNHLDLLAKNQLQKLANKYHVQIEQILLARNFITDLNPKPGNGFSAKDVVSYVTPDLIVISFGDHYEIVLNDFGEPNLQINSYYVSLIDQADLETMDYIKTKIKQAEWLTSCIHQRKTTLLKCAKVILSWQEEFFQKGSGYLQPLTLADVSNEISYHKSTVSRAVKGKYLKCRWGIFPLSFFFTRSIGQGEQERKSQEKIFELLKKVILEEKLENPFSDQKIAELLAQNGCDISRRTVTKYREILQIPSAAVRKIFCRKGKIQNG